MVLAPMISGTWVVSGSKKITWVVVWWTAVSSKHFGTKTWVYGEWFKIYEVQNFMRFMYTYSHTYIDG